MLTSGNDQHEVIYLRGYGDRQLRDSIHQFGAGLQALGLKPGDKVGQSAALNKASMLGRHAPEPKASLLGMGLKDWCHDAGVLVCRELGPVDNC